MINNRTTELLPCPFCGGEVRIGETEFDPGVLFFECADCGVYVEPKNCYADERKAIEAWNARADYHGYKQAAIAAWESIKAWNTRAEHGTLTAEQVMAIAGKHQPDYCSDTHVCFDWQAIADELNAKLGSGTCDDLGGIDANGESTFHCSKCGCILSLYDSEGVNTLCTSFICDYPRFCPECGARIGKAVEI